MDTAGRPPTAFTRQGSQVRTLRRPPAKSNDDAGFHGIRNWATESVLQNCCNAASGIASAQDQDVGRDQQQAEPDFTVIATSLPGVAGAQQAPAEASVRTASRSLNTGMFSSVWKASQAMPCGSVTQCFSLRA